MNTGWHSPERSLPAQQVVLIDDARYRPAFANPGTVTDQEASTVSIREECLMLLEKKRELAYHVVWRPIWEFCTYIATST